MEICVIVRVYNRIDDLLVNIKIINELWKSSQYRVIVVHNGSDSGYVLPESIDNDVYKVISIPSNSGHFSGNAELLRAGAAHIPVGCEFTVLLEADTWLMSDRIVQMYCRILKESNAVWASSDWLDRYFTLGLDFAIVKSEFLKANPKVFEFTKDAEAFVFNYLHRNSFSSIPIKENMPVHIPKLMRKFYNPSGGRFRSFNKSQMVTHHLEDLGGGIDEKLFYANTVFGSKYFDTNHKRSIKLGYLKNTLLRWFAILIPKSKWIKKKKMMNIS